MPAADRLLCTVVTGQRRRPAFLKIMRGFELTRQKQRLYVGAVRNPGYPVRVVWGARDTALSWRRYGVQAQLAAGLDDALLLPGKHFLQEDCADEIAEAVHQLSERPRRY